MTYPEDITERLKSMGARFRGIRVEAGFKQGEVAARIGRSQAYVSHCENGHAAFDVVELIDAADMFGVDLQDLASPRPRTFTRAA